MLAERTGISTSAWALPKPNFDASQIQSSPPVGIGTLLAEGIGDTIRVSLTVEPEKVEVGKEICVHSAWRSAAWEIIAAQRAGAGSRFVQHHQSTRRGSEGHQKPVKVALLGCVVNGPGRNQQTEHRHCSRKRVQFSTTKVRLCVKIKKEEIVPALLENQNLVPRRRKRLFTNLIVTIHYDNFIFKPLAWNRAADFTNT